MLYALWKWWRRSIKMAVMPWAVIMRSFWSEPYLWVHLAGVATLPVLLEVCVLALGGGEPFLPVGLEFLLVAIAGVTPILWMQWQRPFCIFSLVFLALQPGQLSDDQRRLLNFFRTQESKLLTGVAALTLVAILWQLFQVAPLTIDVALPLPGGRVGSLAVAAIAFLLCNLFLQVPVSVARVLAVSDVEMARAMPYPTDRISQDFTLVGLRVKKILPDMIVAPVPAPRPASQVQPSTSAIAWPTLEEKDEAIEEFEEPWEDEESTSDDSEPLSEGFAPSPVESEPAPVVGTDGDSAALEDGADDEFTLSDDLIEETAAQMNELPPTSPEVAIAPTPETTEIPPSMDSTPETAASLEAVNAALESADEVTPSTSEIAAAVEAAIVRDDSEVIVGDDSEAAVPLADGDELDIHGTDTDAPDAQDITLDSVDSDVAELPEPRDVQEPG